jgi:acetoin utilization protein AcuC
MIAAFIYSDAFLGYNLSETHPMKPVRLKMTHRLLDAYGVFNRDCPVVEPRPATREELLQAHTDEFLTATKDLGDGKLRADDLRFGYGTGDNPVFPGLYEASALYAGASVVAAELVASGEARAAFNISGGLHHAMLARASGFCTFNDAVVAIKVLLAKGFDRIAYIDIDAHHGDGVQLAFLADPRVLTISIHESGRFLFPGSGYPEDIGVDEGEGYAVNLQLAPGTNDQIYLEVFDAVVPPLIKAYDPQLIFTQLGADSHYSDPLAHVCLTTRGYQALFERFSSFDKPWVGVGGGGYNPQAVCRLWALAFAEMCGRHLDDQIPSAFAEEWGVERLHDTEDPATTPMLMGNARGMAYESVETIRENVFPIHGLHR